MVEMAFLDLLVCSFRLIIIYCVSASLHTFRMNTGCITCGNMHFPSSLCECVAENIRQKVHIKKMFTPSNCRRHMCHT